MPQLSSKYMYSQDKNISRREFISCIFQEISTKYKQQQQACLNQRTSMVPLFFPLTFREAHYDQ